MSNIEQDILGWAVQLRRAWTKSLAKFAEVRTQVIQEALMRSVGHC